MNRKAWSTEEKTAIVLEMIRGNEPVRTLCARHAVSAIQAYKWREQFLAAAREGLKDKRAKGGRDPILEENRRLKELVGSQALVIDAQKKLAGILETAPNGG